MANHVTGWYPGPTTFIRRDVRFYNLLPRGNGPWTCTIHNTTVVGTCRPCYAEWRAEREAIGDPVVRSLNELSETVAAVCPDGATWTEPYGLIPTVRLSVEPQPVLTIETLNAALERLWNAGGAIDVTTPAFRIVDKRHPAPPIPPAHPPPRKVYCHDVVAGPDASRCYGDVGHEGLHAWESCRATEPGSEYECPHFCDRERGHEPPHRSTFEWD